MENQSVLQGANITPAMFNELEEINRIVEDIINECSDIDDTVMSYANAYFDDSKRILESIEENENDKVSKEKLKEAIATAAVGATIKGAGDVVNAINTIDQANRLLERKKEIAARKLPSMDKAIERSRHTCESYRKSVMAYAEVYYPFDDPEYYPSDEEIAVIENFYMLPIGAHKSKEEIKEKIETLKRDKIEIIKRKNRVSLNVLYLYRKALLNWYMLEFLKCEFTAWSNGKHDSNEMESPSLEIINYNILTNDFYPLTNSDLKNNLAISEKVVKKANHILVEGKDRIDGRFMYIIADEQLFATVLSHLEDATELIQDDVRINPIINNILNDNKTYNKLMEFKDITDKFASGLKKRYYLYGINCALAILAIILVFVYLVNWETWIEIVVGVILAGYCGYKTLQVCAEIDDIYEEKRDVFGLYVVNNLRKIAGYAPKQVTMSEKVEKSYGTIIGAIIGGILGFFFLPFIGGLLIGAFIMAALCSGGSDSKKTESDGSEYVNIKYGAPWKAFIILFGLLFFILLIFA